MVRKRVTKEQFARLKQRSQERPAAQTTEESSWKPLDDEIHRLVQQPGAVSRLRSYVRTSKSLTPTPTKTRVAVHNAALLKTALIKRWGEDKWEEMIGSSPKPGGSNDKDKHAAFSDQDSDSSHTLTHEEVAALAEPASNGPVLNPAWLRRGPVCGHRRQELLREEEEMAASVEPAPNNPVLNQGQSGRRPVCGWRRQQLVREAEEMAASAKPASNDSVFDRALDHLEDSSGREPSDYAMSERRRERERAAKLHKAGIVHPVFGAPGVPDSAHSRIERARERAREATLEAERKAFALQQRKELASKQPKSRLSPHSSVAKAQWAREEIARLQALEQLQHEPTIRALRIVLRTYPGETAHEHSKRLDMAINYLQETKVAHESNPVTLRQMERERAALIRPRLSASETLSVQQMHRAMHRPQGTRLSAPMTEAVRDFLEQSPEGPDLSPEGLAHREGMLPAIVAAIRTPNDAELENDKKIAAAAEAASKKLASKGPVKGHTVWKPTESAVLIIETNQPEPTTPIHQTRSGDVPSTPTAPKKPPPKKPTKKPSKKPTKKPTPTKKKPEPKASKSAKPTGIQKATPPATPAGTRRSSRIIAQSVPARARAPDLKNAQ